MAVFTAIAAAVTAISSWTIGMGALGTFAVGNFMLRAAVQVGASFIAKAFAGDDVSAAAAFAIQGSVQTGGTVPRSFGVGRYLTAGSLAWHSEWGEDGGTPNAYYTQVIALSDLPIAGLSRWFIEGSAVTLEDVSSEMGFAAVEYRVGGKDHAWVRFYDGTQTVVDPFLAGTVNDGAPRSYSSDRIGVGIAYAVVTFRVNQELFTGFPSSKFVLNGVKLYDVSKDSTEGGTGSHRWADPATWGGDGDELPAVQAYNLARGFYYGGQWFYGLQGLTGARLPSSHWISHVEKCRAEIDGEDGLEPTFRASGEISVNSEIGSAFEAILTACAGRISEVGGIFKIYVGAPDASIASFTDADIVSLAPQTFTPFFGLSATVNGVIGSYPSPDEGYTMRSTPPIYSAAFEVEDGGRRLMTDVPLPFVPYAAQAQRLLTGELAAARRARRHTHTLPASFRRVEPGDVVDWTSARNGYEAKLFRVDGVIDLPNCDLIVDLTEVDPSDHGNWVHNSDYRPVYTTALPFVRPAPQYVVGFNAIAFDVEDGAGTPRRAALLVQWDATVDGIAGLIFEVRVAETELVVAAIETRNFAAGAMPIDVGVVHSTNYEVRAKYIPSSPREVSWTSWRLVLSNTVLLGADDLAANAVSWAALADGVRDQITEARAVADGVREDHNELLAGFSLDNLAALEVNYNLAVAANTAAQDAATASGVSAGAASESKDIAGSHADDAGAAALAASEFLVSAEAVRDEANESRAAASVSETNAANSEVLAAGSSGIAVAAKETAVAISSQGGGVLSDMFLPYSSISWDPWQTAPVISPNEIYPVGNTASFNIGAENAGLYLDSNRAIWTGPHFADGFRIEVLFELVSGGLSGAGFLFDFHNATAYERKIITLQDMVSGPITFNQVQKGSIVVTKSDGFVNTPNRVGAYLMANYSEVGANTAKNIKFHSVQFYPITKTEASVKTLETAVVDLAGNASAGYLIKAQAGGAVSLLDLIAADGEGGPVSVARISAQNILLDGTVSANQLSIGGGRNLLQYSDFRAEAQHSIAHAGANTAHSQSVLYYLTGSYWDGFNPTLTLRQDGTSTSGYTEAYLKQTSISGGSQYIPVDPGEWYDFSAALNTHRCSASVILYWIGGTGSIVGATVSPLVNSTKGVDALTWSRFGAIGQAPTDAAFCMPTLRKHGTNSSTNSYLFAVRPMFAKTHSAATEFTPYERVAYTFIDGGQIVTNSIKAEHIDVTSLSAISATLGHFKSAASGARVEIKDDKIVVYRADNSVAVKIGNLA
jgi:hypothetical protein